MFALSLSRAGRLALLVAVLATILTPGAVLAHAELTTSDPAAGSTIPAPPSRINLDFSDGLRPNSHFEVLDSGGATVATGTPDAAKKDRMSADGSRLAPGRYTVMWTTVATDGDVARGTFRFTIAEPTPPSPSPSVTPSATASATPSPTAVASPSATPAPSPSPAPGPVSATDAVFPIVAGLVLVAGLGLWLAGRQRRL